MPAITRRRLSASFLVAAAFSALPLQAQAAEELKIGYQKTGLPVIARQQGVIEKALEAQTLAANHSEFGIVKIDDRIVASQQETADRFYGLGLIPKQISIKDAVWSGATN